MLLNRAIMLKCARIYFATLCSKLCQNNLPGPKREWGEWGSVSEGEREGESGGVRESRGVREKGREWGEWGSE